MNKDTENAYPILLEWMRSRSKIDDKMIWKDAALKQMTFVRDTLCTYFLHVPVFVVSTHRSKSITLPVYKFELNNGINVIMRENFYGWVVSIKSPFSISLPKDIVKNDGGDDIASCYCEGFKEDWVFPFCTENCRLSTFRVSNDYELYTLFYILNKLKNSNKKEDDNEIENLSTVIVKMVIENEMKIHKNVDLRNVFPHTYSITHGCNFCEEHNLLTYVSVGKDEIEDFAKRIILTEETKKIFILEMNHLYKGHIEEETTI